LTHQRAVKCTSHGFLPDPSDETTELTGVAANKEVEAEKSGLLMRTPVRIEKKKNS